jgi:membrane-associated phospholipid phosphatase
MRMHLLHHHPLATTSRPPGQARRARRPRVVAVLLLLALVGVVPQAWAAQPPVLADDAPSQVAVVWFETLYDVVKAEATGFAVASRIYGVSAVALYEAMVPGTRHHRSLVGQLHRLTAVPPPEAGLPYHWPTVANAALARTIRGLFPALQPQSMQAIDAVEQRFAALFHAEVDEQEYQRSVAHGQRVADAILAWAATDGFADVNNCPYEVDSEDPAAWQPTPPNFVLPPEQPCWGQLQPMVLASSTECAPPGPPAFSTDPASDFYAAALEVYQVSQTLTAEQQTIAQYWADFPGTTATSSGHWVAIVSQIVRNEGLSLAAAAEAYARLGIAVTDAFIMLFDAKYQYNLVRPVTYIQAYIDDTWLPYLVVTPPNPSYPSTHATQSSAAATVLTDLFGAKAFIDTTHLDHHLMPPQQPRVFRSFTEAAAEAAISRLYGGIHYAFDADDGRVAGQCVGQAINDRVDFQVR